ncbi:exo-beta-N-acetylmuramidase NamZ domain-containing protein, partial [Singulisphaera rosea]
MRLIYVLAILVSFTSRSSAALPEAKPAEVQLDGSRLTEIDRVVERAIASKEIPGAVVVVGRKGRIAFAKAYGHRAVVPVAELMTRDTI